MAHAKLSPSGADRWLTCTKAPSWEENYPDSTSEFAEEGTLAHTFAETYLRYHDDPKGLKKALKALEKDPLYAKYYSEELSEHAQDFADYVLERCTGIHILAIEQRLDLTDWVEEGFGTGDAIVVKDGVLDLIDLKYGRGVKVSSVENKQLMIYGLGCYAKYSWMYEFDTIRLNIFQPRLNNISVWSISVEDLLKWADEVLTPKAKLAYAGEGEEVPGEHCRFCRHKANCRALSNLALEMAEKEFDEALTPEEIGEIIPKMDVVEIYIKAVREHAYSKLLSGEKIPGFKLVKGRSTRVLKDLDVIESRLIEAGFPEDKIKTEPVAPKLLGLTALERAVGKKAFSELLSDCIARQDGKPTLAPETDKREEYSSVEADFGEEDVV